MTRRERRDSINLAKLIVILSVLAYYLKPEWREHLPLVGAIVAGVAVAAAIIYIWWSRRSREQLLGQLAFEDRMKRLTWQEFEQACAVLFERRGYRASLTDEGADDGVDIRLSKDGRSEIVQCKHYPEGQVGAPQVRELLGAREDFGAERAYLLTSGSFTRPAHDLAERNRDLVLWDGHKISSVAKRFLAQDILVGSSGAEQQGAELAPAEAESAIDEGLAGSAVEAAKTEAEDETAPEASEMTCPRCDRELAVREGRYGRFIGCIGFPKCRYTRDLDDGEVSEHTPS